VTPTDLAAIEALRTSHPESWQDVPMYSERQLQAAVAAERRRRSTLAQVPAGDICPAEVTTFTGLKLECERTGPHRMHYDTDQGIWWAHQDEADSDPLAAECQRIALALEALARDVPAFASPADGWNGPQRSAIQWGLRHAAHRLRNGALGEGP
jgi:hypothetical protein